MSGLSDNLPTTFDTSVSCSNDGESAINTDYIAAGTHNNQCTEINDNYYIVAILALQVNNCGREFIIHKIQFLYIQ